MTGKVPSGAADPYVQQWLTQFHFSGTPVFVDYEDQGQCYKTGMCHVNAKHAAVALGGERVLGWSIFLFEPEHLLHPVAHAEPHSVVRKPGGELVDVTPPKWGASRVLFLEDSGCKLRKLGNDYILPCELSCTPGMPWWVGHKPQFKATWKMPFGKPDLREELKRLGLKDML